jgi:hypothetical protein
MRVCVCGITFYLNERSEQIYFFVIVLDYKICIGTAFGGVMPYLIMWHIWEFSGLVDQLSS